MTRNYIRNILKKIFGKKNNAVILPHYNEILQNHFYLTNGIVSHQTVSTAISILHYVTFNKEKNVMITANKGATVVEIN